MSDKTRIGDHAKVRRGASPRPIGDPKYFGGTVGWVRISDVTSARKYLRKTEQYVSPLGESLSVRVDHGDLIMSICATIGRPVIVDMPACIHDGFVQFYEVKNDDKEYMYYLLQFHEKDLERKGQPGTQVNLNTTIVENFEAFFPTSLSEQRKIARILTTVDAVIEKTEAAIAKYKSIKVGMMRDLFTRGIDVKTGKLRPSFEDAPELYKQSELGMVPKEWEVVRIGDFSSIKGGKRLPAGRDFSDSETPFPYLRVTDMVDGSIIQSDLKYVPIEIEPTIRSYKISTKDIYVTIAGTLGLFGTIPDNLDNSQLTENAAKITEYDSNEFERDYIKHQCNSVIIQSQINREIGVGGGVPKLALFRIARFSFLKPTIKEQSISVSRINMAEELIKKETANLNKYQQLKQALMADLLTGKVRVKYNENEIAEAE